MRPLLPGIALAMLVITAVPSAGSRPQESALTPIRQSPLLQTPRAAISLSIHPSGVQVAGPEVESARRRGVVGTQASVFELLGPQGRRLARVHADAGRLLRILGRDGRPLALETSESGDSERVDSERASVTWRGIDGAEFVIEAIDATPVDIVAAEGGQPGAWTPAASPGASGDRETALEFALLPNRPNPFRNLTVIRYALPKPGRVQMEVFDVAGRQVATLLDEVRTAGPGHVDYRPCARAAGRYEVRMTFAPSDGSATRRATRPILFLQ